MTERSTAAGRILIVDDEAMNVALLERMLGHAGYAFLTSTTDSTQALALFQTTKPDLVVLDLVMPYPDGFELMRRFAEVALATAPVPTLVLTADATPEALRKALSGGANDFLTKPFDQTELLLRVRNLLTTRFLHLGLQHQVDALGYLNAQSQDEVRERNQSLSAISHDLRQPLTALIMSIDVLKEELADGVFDAADVVAELARIAEMGRQVEEMTCELSDLARLQTGGGLLLRPCRVSLNRLAQTAADQMRRSFLVHSFRLDAPAREVVGEWDPVRVQRVMSNLLLNAIKYSPAGGEILVALDSVVNDGERVARLAVSDHGIGIPAADLPFVFDQFYRARNVPDSIGGSGVGLAGVKQIVEQHGGTIGIRSLEGRGTTVTVDLPLPRAV